MCRNMVYSVSLLASPYQTSYPSEVHKYTPRARSHPATGPITCGMVKGLPPAQDVVQFSGDIGELTDIAKARPD